MENFRLTNYSLANIPAHAHMTPHAVSDIYFFLGLKQLSTGIREYSLWAE